MTLARPSVCFVCLGNICRSPTAEGVFRHLLGQAGLDERVVVDSAGTGAYHLGKPPDRRAVAAARRRGIEVAGAARRFERADAERFDWVLAMDQENLADLRPLVGLGGRARLQLLRDFDPAAPPGASVPDPYYGGDAGFDEVVEQCLAACAGLLVRVRAEHGL